MLIILILIWFLIGIVSGIIGTMIHDGQLKIKDIVYSIVFGGVLGPVLTIVAIISIIATLDCGEKIIWRKK